MRSYRAQSIVPGAIMSSVKTLPFSSSYIRLQVLRKRSQLISLTWRTKPLVRKGGLNSKHTRGTPQEGLGAVEADAGDGLRRIEPGLAPRHHPPCPCASHMQGLNDWVASRAVPHPQPLSLVPCLPRRTYLHHRHENH